LKTPTGALTDGGIWNLQKFMSDWKNGGCRQITEQKRRASAAMANSIISIVHRSLTAYQTAG
jgi:hypothetical protein